MLVGNSIVLVVYGYYMGNTVLNWFASLALSAVYSTLLQISISGFIILLTGEFIPKVFFHIYANTLIRLFAVPAYLFYNLFYWISRFVISISDFFLINILRTRGDKQQAFFSRGELGHYITEQMTGVDKQEEVDSEIQIFQNALEFADLKARDVMTPRTEISAVDVNDEILHLRDLFITTGYSKMVVYEGSMDNITGYVHSFDLFRKPETISAVMIPIEYAPETVYIKELLNTLTRKRKTMAVILDEYGGTSGIVTVEDIIEELFGEIKDEHDEEEDLTETALEDGSYLFSARLDVEYINEKHGLSIPVSDSYATLGGFIVAMAKDIPETGEHLDFENFIISIVQASGKKIEIVKIRPLSLK
jgi:putative hemolysin